MDLTGMSDANEKLKVDVETYQGKIKNLDKLYNGETLRNKELVADNQLLEKTRDDNIAQIKLLEQ